MENSILNQLPFYPIYIMIVFLVLIAILLILIAWAFSKIRRLDRKFDYFMRGKDAESLEDVILDQIDEIKNLKACDEIPEQKFQSLIPKIGNRKILCIYRNGRKFEYGNRSFGLYQQRIYFKLRSQPGRLLYLCKGSGYGADGDCAGK